MTYELDALRAKVPMRGVRIFDQPRIFDRQCGLRAKVFIRSTVILRECTRRAAANHQPYERPPLYEVEALLTARDNQRAG
jgi:hypothetical protein